MRSAGHEPRNLELEWFYEPGPNLPAKWCRVYFRPVERVTPDGLDLDRIKPWAQARNTVRFRAGVRRGSPFAPGSDRAWAEIMDG